MKRHFVLANSVLISCAKIQETCTSRGFLLAEYNCIDYLSLPPNAMTFAEANAAVSFHARAINFHFAFLSGMGGRFHRRAAFLREMGIDLKNAAAKLQLATRPPPVCPRAPPGHPFGVPFRSESTPRAFSFAVPDLLNACFFTVREISLRRARDVSPLYIFFVSVSFFDLRGEFRPRRITRGAKWSCRWDRGSCRRS